MIDETVRIYVSFTEKYISLQIKFKVKGSVNKACFWTQVDFLFNPLE